MNMEGQTLSDLSSLTETQVETLRIQLSIEKGEINMVNALKLRKSSGISRGTHDWVLAQAKHNVLESLFTVAVGVQMGLLKQEDVQKFLSAAKMIPENVDSDKLPQVMSLIRALAGRIVML